MNDQRQEYQTGDPRGPEDMGHDVIVSPDTRREQRIPPGQVRTRKWPVLHYGRVPLVSTDRWRLEVRGLVETPFSLT